jgi:glycosyltransferase involved in cell wall biosynthesis
MRIAVYHNLSSGGGKRALHEMVRRLDNEHEIDVYTLSCAEHDFCDLRPHCNQHIVFPFSPIPLVRRPFGRLNQGIRAVDLLRLRTLQQRIAAQIDANRYDVVFVHHCRYGQAPSLLQFLSTPSVYYCQEPPRLLYEPRIPRPYAQYSTLQRFGNGFDPFPPLYRMLLKQLDRNSAQAASLVLANSFYSVESLYRTYGLFARVCYLGVDTQLFRSLSLSKKDFVASVGAIRPNKGFDFLLYSLALLDPEHRLPLVIVSNYADERERYYLRDLAARLGVQLEFRTLVSDKELVRLYCQAQLTLYAPVMEPFGFVPIESMGCGTPVVGVAEGGVRETVQHGETGLLADRDPQLFADALTELWSKPLLAEKLGRKGPAYVQECWNWDDAIARLESYLTVAAKGSSR